MKNRILILALFLASSLLVNAQNWVQKGADIDGEATADNSGWSLSMSTDGNSIAIGAYGNGNLAGQVRVYSWSGSAWTQKGSDINGEATGDYSGLSVSMSSNGSSLAIGAHYNDGNGTDAGQVRVYSWSGSAWTQKGLDIDGEAAGDFAGSVCMSSDGNSVVIGASNNDGTGVDAGQVRVYSWNGSAWTQKGTDINGEASGDNFGWIVSMSADGNSIAIGARRNDGKGTDAGQVRAFSWSGSAWTQKGTDIDGEASGDNFGWSVSMGADGNSLAIGAPYNDGSGLNAGHVRVFTWSGSAWTQKGLDIDGKGVGMENCGISVSISSDGNTIAIGAPGSDENGTDAGQVRVYLWSGSAWTQKGPDINSEAAGDFSGASVIVSSDGSSVAIGAPFNDGNGTYAGHVRVFKYGASSGITPNVFAYVQVQVYPNPASDHISISFSNAGLPNRNISIFNSLGIEVKRFDAREVSGKASIAFSTESLPIGIYYCAMNNGFHTIAERFLIMR